ncbi:MAG TPA: cysteine peptidase family C39 domain-containing protein [Armatimonadota bacterium]|nr:cysteine peptidase family C39 domain-containing protein [Armatimonadota bacterium]
MSRMRLFIAAAVAAGCIAIVIGAGSRDRSGRGAYYYRSGQHALVRHDLKTAAADFKRAASLTNDPDKRAWAQYQLAECQVVQPTKRSEAIAALRALIEDEPRHFLAARAQAELDRLEGKKTHPFTPPPLDVDCGPEALAYILQHSFGKRASVSSLRHLAGAGPHGATLLGLQKAAEASGLKAVGMKVDLNYLRRMPPPAILWIRRSHYIAFLSTEAAIAPPFWKIRVYDPAGTHEEVITPEELQKTWDGYLLKISAPRKA